MTQLLEYAKKNKPGLYEAMTLPATPFGPQRRRRRPADTHVALEHYCSFVQKSTPVKPEGKELWSAVVRGGNGKVGRGWTLEAAVLAAVEEPSAAALDVV